MTAKPPDREHSFRQHLSPRQLGQMVSHFWSSDVNKAAVGLLAPQSGDHILDLGAGLGPATIDAANHVGPTGTVVAVDPSLGMRTILRIRCLWHPMRGQIKTYKGTGEELPLPNDSIDGVMALNVMHHLKDIDATARELARVVRPGGRLVLVDEDFGHPEHTFHNTDEPDGHGPDYVDLDHMSEVLTAAGFVETNTRRMRFGTQPSYVITAARADQS